MDGSSTATPEKACNSGYLWASAAGRTPDAVTSNACEPPSGLGNKRIRASRIPFAAGRTKLAFTAFRSI